MAAKKKFANGTIQYRFTRVGLLSKPLYLTFDDEAKGDEYAKRIEALLDRGIVPPEFQRKELVGTVLDLVRMYERDAHPSAKDRKIFGPILKAHGTRLLTDINAKWVDGWVAEMKRVEKLTPASIQARVGALARCTDWGVRKHYITLPDNPLRNLPFGYATYTKSDESAAGIRRENTERDRRLEPGEQERILAVIDGGRLPRKLRPFVIQHKEAVRCLFLLGLESAMRLREMYTLTLEQVDFSKRTVFLDKTKNGDKRQVPMSTVAVAALKAYLDVRTVPPGHPDNALFPWWNGSFEAKVLHDVTLALGTLFNNPRHTGIFQAAQCDDLHFHDLRHTAVCHLYERTKLTDLQISKITGHRSLKMLARYANLRGSDLAAALW